MLSIIIINYRTPALLRDCISSIYSRTTGIAFEVIVVDNASGDDSRQIICTLFPAVKWIQMYYNGGFARANNQGIGESSGDTVLLLNSDTVVSDNAIGNCYVKFVNSEYVACGIQLLNADGTPQISGNYVMTGGLNNLLSLPYTGAFVKILGRLFKVTKPHVASAEATVEVDWINGAFLMVKKSAIQKAGMMDEDFFLYAEEAEWCSRLKKTGKLALFGQFRILHLQGETSNMTFKSTGKGYTNLYDKKGLQIMISNFVRVRKEFGTGWFLFQLFVYSFTVIIFLVCSLVETIVTLGRINRFRLLSNYTYNILKVWRYTPRIVANRPYFYKIL